MDHKGLAERSLEKFLENHPGIPEKYHVQILAEIQSAHRQFFEMRK
jgi:hypothetical protein